MFGLYQGYVNAGVELHGVAGVIYGTGFALVAYLLITLLSAAAHVSATDRAWGSTAIRAVVSWIAAAGTMYAGLLFTNQ